MLESRERLIDAAVRPFSDNAELKQSAINFLEKHVTADAGDAAAMVARWDGEDAGKRSSAWGIGLWVALAGVTAAVLCSDLEEISRLGTWGEWLAAGSIYAPLPDTTQRLASQLGESDKLLLLGDLTRESKSERKEALWQSEPENPAYFADYAGAFIQTNEKLPPDFLETARRIDPTNAWFTYLAAAVEAKDSVKSKSRKSKRVAGKTVYESPPSWEILDQARLDRVIALVVEARSQPKCTDYSAAMLRKRLPLLPEGSFIEQLDSAACLAGTSTFSSLRLLRLAHAIAAKACCAGESGDVPGFQEISGDGERFIRGICSDDNGTVVDEMGRRIMVSTLADSFSSAAETLGLEHGTARWKPVEKSMLEAKERLNSREFMVDGKAVESGKITGGIIDGGIEMIAKRPETQPPLTDADLKPMRLVDHEILSWVLSYLSWIVMAVCLGVVACYRFRVTVLSRRLARRMTDLLRPSDWRWIIAVGVVLPFVFVMTVNRLTPLGGRAFGVQGTALLMPAGHFLGLLLLWLTLPVQVIRWRMGKRAGEFGFPGSSRMGWLAVAGAAAFVPVIGRAAISHVGGSWLNVDEILKFPWQLWAATALASVSVLWVAGLVSLAMLGRADRHLYRATSALVLVRAYAVALLVIALASIEFKAAERYWFKQDWMSKFDVSGPGWNAYESRVAAQMRKELRETLGYDH